MRQFKNKTIAITGGASGLGRALVEKFIQEEANVVVLDKNQEALTELSQLYSGNIATVCGDVSLVQSNLLLAQVAEDRFGGLDVFIGNAGIWDYGKSLADMSLEQIDQAFDEVFSINTKAYMLGLRAVLPLLVKSQGNVIFTLSNAAFYSSGGGPLYTASKHADVGLIKQLAFELAPLIRVNGVAPGAILSDLRGPKSLGQDGLSIKNLNIGELVKDGVPLHKLPSIEDYLDSYLYLASSKSSGFMTGNILQIDGGIGVRGLASVSGGDDLSQKFNSHS